uniref:C-type lectin domain-containing protein n=1 Tax=Macrostomum lignano TaxID=282301 RepID=A0A1I8JL14_9PLAT
MTNSKRTVLILLILQTLSSAPNCVESVSCPDTNWLSYNQNCYLLVNGEFGQSHSAATTFCQELEDNCGLLWLDSLDEKAWVGSQSWDLRAQRGSCKNCGLMDAAWVALYREQQAPCDFYWRRGNGPPVKDDILTASDWYVGHPKPPDARSFQSAITELENQRFRYRNNGGNETIWFICKLSDPITTTEEATSDPTTLETDHTGT